MKMGDPLLSIYLLFLNCCLHSPSACSLAACLSFTLTHTKLTVICFYCFSLSLVFHYTNPRATMMGLRTATPISMPNPLLSSLSCFQAYPAPCWDYRLGYNDKCHRGCPKGWGQGLDLSPNNSHLSLWLKTEWEEWTRSIIAADEGHHSDTTGNMVLWISLQIFLRKLDHFTAAWWDFSWMTLILISSCRNIWCLPVSEVYFSSSSHLVASGCKLNLSSAGSASPSLSSHIDDK